ncbi:MAG: hypothetical protein AMXMBFR45_16170 [Gammaproteobacteria bacterium]|nr:MAG: hypothetical protein BroJett010_02080 [Gammaproteobacteria bacterium]
MALDAGQFLQHDRHASLRQAGSQFALLVDRVQDVGFHTDDHGSLHTEAPEASGYRAAVLGEVEEIAGARQGKVAGWIELADELLRVGLQVRLDLEVRRVAIPALALLRNTLTAEALLPFPGRAVGDHAELARHAHARQRAGRGIVAAGGKGRILQHHLPLQRPQCDGVGQGTRGAGNQQQAARLAGILRSVGQCGHAAHRRPHQRMQHINAEVLQQAPTSRGHVLQGQHREVEPVGSASRRIG